MRRGVNTRLTTLRCHSCCGGSFVMSSDCPISPPSSVTPFDEMNVAAIEVRR